MEVYKKLFRYVPNEKYIGYMTIMLVEDDPHIGDGIAAGLKKLGMAVDWFSDGAQGQSAPLAAPYDEIGRAHV